MLVSHSVQETEGEERNRSFVAVSRTQRILEQGEALVRAIEALETIQKTAPLERPLVWFLLKAYRHRLREIAGAAPSWMGGGKEHEEGVANAQRL